MKRAEVAGIRVDLPTTSPVLLLRVDGGPVHVPIWIGGNSQLSRRRVAQVGNGWNPFPAPRTLAATTKTVPLESVGDLAPLLDDLWQRVDEAGRDRSEIDVSCANFGRPDPGSPQFDAADSLQGIAELADLGVTWTSTNVPGDSVDHAIEALEQYGKQVIAES